MQSEWCDMSLPQLLDMVFTELACKADASSDSPRTLAEAMKRPDREHWWAAAMEEVDALEQNGTFTVRERTWRLSLWTSPLPFSMESWTETSP